MAVKRRVNVDFSEETYHVLEELARQRGTSMAEILRDAIGLEQWFEQTKREGARILVERDGKVREIVRT